MSVVVGYDGSPASQAALRVAAEEARLRGLDVDVVTAWEQPTVDIGMGMGATVDPRMAQILADRAAQLAAGAAEELVGLQVRATGRGMPGPAAAALVDSGAVADLIVVGANDHGVMGELLAGATSAQVAAHAMCPVICARAGAADAGGQVVVGIDGSPQSARALDFAFDEASRRSWALKAVHAWDVSVIGFDVDDSTYPHGGILDDIRDVETRLGAEVLAGHRARYPDVEVQSQIVRGPAAGVLIEAAVGARMLVVGSRGRGGFKSLLLGSVSRKALHHARCSVAVVH